MHAASSSSSCACERGSDAERIRCLVNHFEIFMRARCAHLSQQHIQSMRETRRLVDIKLLAVEVSSITEEYVESAILFAFIKNYIKTHPRFQYDGPDTGDLQSKTTFFETT